MDTKLDDISRRLDEINEALGDPANARDPEKLKALMIERKKIQPIAEKYNELKEARREMSEADEILSDKDSDDELREMAYEQQELARSEIERLELELKTLLIPKDENDERNVIVEIRAGTGGEEAALFAALIFRMYQM